MKDDEPIRFSVYQSGLLSGTPNLDQASESLDQSWQVFRKILKPKYWIVWRDIAVCYLFLIIGVVLLFFAENLTLIFAIIATLLIAVWLGYWFHSLSLFLHEATHFNVHPNSWWNDFLANALIASLLLVDIKTYRKIHWDHHLFLGSPEDTETSYFHALTPGFILQTLTGVHAIRTLLKYSGHKKEHSNFKNILRLSITHSLIVGSLLLFDYYIVTAGWAIGLMLTFPFFGVMRQLLRHRDENADQKADYTKVDHGSVLRSFGKDWFSRTFGNAGFNVHMLHHWDPHISYTRLGDMEEYFQKTELGDLIQNCRRTYWRLFWKFLKRNKLP